MNLNSMNAGALDAAFARVVGQQGMGGEPPGEAPVVPQPDYLSVNQVCELLGVSRAKWYYMTNPHHKYYDATIPPWKPVGKRGRKYRRDLIVAWVENGGIAGPAA